MAVSLMAVALKCPASCSVIEVNNQLSTKDERMDEATLQKWIFNLATVIQSNDPTIKRFETAKDYATIVVMRVIELYPEAVAEWLEAQ